MGAITFDTLKYSKRLVEAGYTQQLSRQKLLRRFKKRF